MKIGARARVDPAVLDLGGGGRRRRQRRRRRSPRSWPGPAQKCAARGPRLCCGEPPMRPRRAGGSALGALLLLVLVALSGLVPTAEAKNKSKSRADRMIRAKRTECDK